MSQTRNRWLVKTVMLIGAIFFLGSTIFPLLGSVQPETPSIPETAVNPQASPTAKPQSKEEELKNRQEQLKNKQEELKAKARGLEMLLQQEPDNQTALGELANVQLQVGDRRGVTETLEKLAKLNPDVSVQLALGEVYAQQQRYDDAIAVFDNAIKANKEDFRPVFAKAIVLQLQGKTPEAKELFTTATNLAPAEIKERVKTQIQQLQTEIPAPNSSPANSSSGDSKPQSASPAPNSSPGKN